MVRGDDGEVFVSVRRVCEALGVDMSGQLQKLKAKPWAIMEFISTLDAAGRDFEVSCLHLDALPMWLATIEASRVAEHVRPKPWASVTFMVTHDTTGRGW